MKRKKWVFKLPSEVYASDFIFKKPVTLRHAKQYVRDWLRVKRLPRGTEYWPGDY